MAELGSGEGRCLTCRRLGAESQPSDAVLAAMLELLGQDTRPKSWKTARDARHVVVEVDLGWTRKAVFAVLHGQSRAEGGISHSLLGSRSLRNRDG